MVHCLRTALGVAIGLTAAAVVLNFYRGGGGPVELPSGPLLSDCDGRRIVYMPTFAGADAMNRAAAAVWRELDYEVRPVACDACYRRFGVLHCLVNVLRREL